MAGYLTLHALRLVTVASLWALMILAALSAFVMAFGGIEARSDVPNLSEPLG